MTDRVTKALPPVAFEVHRAEALRQIELASKRGLQACVAVAITYLYGMGGYDGTVRAEGRIKAQFKADTNNGRTARRHITLGNTLAKRLRQLFGKGAEDETCLVSRSGPGNTLTKSHGAGSSLLKSTTVR